MRKTKITALILAAILVFSCLLTGCGAGGAKNAVKKFVKAELDCDAETVVNLIVDDYWLEVEGEDRADLIEDELDDLEEEKERLEDKYGTGLKIKDFKATEYDYDKEDVELFEKALNKMRENCYPHGTVQALVVVEYEYTLKGSDDEKHVEDSKIAFKIDGKWYLQNGDRDLVDEIFDYAKR